MQNNFIRVAAANIDVKLLNVEENKKSIIQYLDFACKNSIDVLTFPELCLTGVSAGEMTVSDEIICRCEKALEEIIEYTQDKKILFSLGLPIKINGAYLNALAVIFQGNLYSLLIKDSLSYEESKYFNKIEGHGKLVFESLNQNLYSGEKKAIFTDKNSDINIAFIHENEFMENKDLYNYYISNNVNLIFIAGSSYDDASSLDYRSDLFKALSKRDNIAIVYAGASSNESSTNNVYSGQKLIFEAGNLINSSNSFSNGIIYTEINKDEIKAKSKHMVYGEIVNRNTVDFVENSFQLSRSLSSHPLIPNDEVEFSKKAKNILNLQAQGLIRRLNQLPNKNIFLGLSGGLDSTLALIVSCIAYTKMGLDMKGIYAITMPGLGTSSRTKTNAMKLAEEYGVTLMEIPITASVTQHFMDIGHDINDTSVVYENAQARERTQILMDMSNKYGGIVLGTGNMSEVALGWSTYNADHMCMYNVNGGICKTLLREIVRFVMKQSDNVAIKTTLSDILDTPISPELLPTNEEGNIAQKTEDNVGPYELHDFFIYHVIRNKSKFNDVLFMAENAFKDKYTKEEIKKYLNIFLRRFSTQQFKRSCMPDGLGVEDFSLNPRNGLIMASDIDILKTED